MIGVIAGISKLLADANVSIFAISTYDTDYFLVKTADLGKAECARLLDQRRDLGDAVEAFRVELDLGEIDREGGQRSGPHVPIA